MSYNYNLPMDKLIHVSQIAGIEDLIATITLLQNMYDARKVYTTIEKIPGENYNVDELLNLLKSQVDSLLNKAIRDKVRLNAELYMGGQRDVSVPEELIVLTPGETYQTHIHPVIAGSQTLYRRVGSDPYEEIEIDEYDFDYNNGTFVLHEVDTTEGVIYAATYSHNVPGQSLYFVPPIPDELYNRIEKDRAYNIYYDNNLPVQNETGYNLTYRFDTNDFNGTASIRDPDDDEYEDGISYIPLTNPVNVKLYPIGDYVWQELDDSYLIDNDEYNLIRYQQYLDDIYVKLQYLLNKCCNEGSSGGMTAILGEDMSPYELAIKDTDNKLYRCNATVYDHADKVYCFTLEGGLAGDEVHIQTSGTLTVPSWSWVPGQPLFADINPGQVTQTVPTNPPFLWSYIVAEVQTPTTINITINSNEAIMLLP